MVGARQSPVDLAVLVVAEVVWVGLVPCASLGDESSARGNGLSHEGGFGGGGKDFGGDDSPEDGFDVGRLKDGEFSVLIRGDDELGVEDERGEFSVFVGDAVKGGASVRKIDAQKIFVGDLYRTGVVFEHDAGDGIFFEFGVEVV